MLEQALVESSLGAEKVKIDVANKRYALVREDLFDAL